MHSFVLVRDVSHSPTSFAYPDRTSYKIHRNQIAFQLVFGIINFSYSRTKESERNLSAHFSIASVCSCYTLQSMLILALDAWFICMQRQRTEPKPNCMHKFSSWKESLPTDEHTFFHIELLIFEPKNISAKSWSRSENGTEKERKCGTPEMQQDYATVTLLKSAFGCIPACMLSNACRLHENGSPMFGLVVSKLLIVCKSMSKVVISLTRLTHTGHIFSTKYFIVFYAFAHTTFAPSALFGILITSPLFVAVVKRLHEINPENGNSISFGNSTTHPNGNGYDSMQPTKLWDLKTDAFSFFCWLAYPQ